MGILCCGLICRNAIGRRAPHPEANAPSAALRHGPFPRINSPLAYSPKQPGAALGRLEVDHADHQRASDRVSRIPPTPSSSAREGFGPFDTDHRGWCLVADVGAPLEHARIVGDGTDAYCRSPGAHCRRHPRASVCPRDAAAPPPLDQRRGQSHFCGPVHDHRHVLHLCPRHLRRSSLRHLVSCSAPEKFAELLPELPLDPHKFQRSANRAARLLPDARPKWRTESLPGRG